MLSDPEVDALARSILKEGVEYVNELQPQLFKIVTAQCGELGLEFAVTSNRGDGSVRCLYYPLEPIKRLIVESEHLFDGFVIELSDKQTGEVLSPKLSEYAHEHRERGIRLMARPRWSTTCRLVFPAI